MQYYKKTELVKGDFFNARYVIYTAAIPECNYLQIFCNTYTFKNYKKTEVKHSLQSGTYFNYDKTKHGEEISKTEFNKAFDNALFNIKKHLDIN